MPADAARREANTEADDEHVDATNMHAIFRFRLASKHFSSLSRIDLKRVLSQHN